MSYTEMTPEQRKLRNRRIKSLLKHPKTPRKLIEESYKRWGYSEMDTRMAWLALDCRPTKTWRLRLPRKDEEPTWDWA